MPVTPRAEDYIVKASKLDDEPVARLVFFRDYLEDEETMIARDAYDEFASAPYDLIQKIGPHMDHDQLIEWSSNRRSVRIESVSILQCSVSVEVKLTCQCSKPCFVIPPRA